MKVPARKGTAKAVQRCVDFHLAPLTAFPPQALTKARADTFIIALALCFNDLKGLLWYHDRLDAGRDPSEVGATPYNGQRSAMMLQAQRLLSGILFELLGLIKKAGIDDRLLDDPEFVAALASIPSYARRDWKELVGVARTWDTKDPYWKYLLRVRNDGAFHYSANPRILAEGYHRHFFESPPNERNISAFMSLGDSMEETRFYFADAAAEGFEVGLRKTTGGSFEQTIAHVKRANRALRSLIEAYVMARTERAKT
jgi:hypothetical protein